MNLHIERSYSEAGNVNGFRYHLEDGRVTAWHKLRKNALREVEELALIPVEEAATDAEVLDLTNEAPVQLELDLDATISGTDSAPLTERTVGIRVQRLEEEATSHRHLAVEKVGQGRQVAADGHFAKAHELEARANRYRDAMDEGGIEAARQLEAEEYAAKELRRASRRELATLVAQLREVAPELLAE